jgi:hypothetical protein
MISIGTPERGKQLVYHLGLFHGENYLFVDPDNALYDALDLNRGIQRTFFNPSTPFAFLNRLQKEGGLNDLVEILAKWRRGT